MKLPKIAIENYQFTIVAICAFIFLGIGAMLTMPRAEDPGIKGSMGHVIVIYPGATGDDMEKLVTEPIEEALNELEDIDVIKSNSENSLSWINVRFDFDSELDDRFAEVKETVNALRGSLPSGISSIEVKREDISNVNVFQMALVSKTDSFHDMVKRAEKIKDEIARIDGIKNVEIHGAPDEIVSIEPEIETLSKMGISPQDIVNAVKSYNVNIPGGSLNIGSKKFNVQTSGSYETLDDIKYTVIHAKNGSPVYIKDVAHVSLAYKDHTYKTRYNSERALLITAQQKDATDIFGIMENVHQIHKKWQTKIEPSMALYLAFDQSLSVEKRISEFVINLMEGILLVGIVIFFAVGYRASAIIMLAIPLSFIIGLGFIDLSGFGIQQMTIAGLVIALGLLVDNAIVVTENIHKFLKKGYKGTDAAIKATSQVAWPIVSSTATTILAFLPMMMMQNESGDFIRSMPTTVIFTLTASLIVSLTLTPFLASKFFASKDLDKENKFQNLLQNVIDIRYRNRLKWSIENGKSLLLIAILVLFGSLFFAKYFIGVSMFPKAEKPQFIVNIELPKGTSITHTENAVNEVEAVLKKQPEVRYYFSNIGKGNPMIHYAHRGKKESSYYAQFFIEIDESVGRNTEQFTKDLRHTFKDFPSGRIEVKEFEQGPPKEAPIAIKIIGDNLETLTQLAAQIEDSIASIEGTINITNPSKIPVTDLHVNIHKEKALALGVPIHLIDQTVRVALTGMAVSTFRNTEGDKYDIVLRLPVNNNPTMQDFDRIYITSAIGKQIPLKELAEIEFTTGKSEIEHYDLERAITITSDVEGRTANEVTNEVIAKIQKLSLPDGYRFHVAGEREAQQKAFGGMATATILAMLFIYGVLVLQFNSFSQPLIVFSAIPLAVIGSVIALFFAGYTFSFTAFVGLTSLVGIVVNNSILLVEYSNELRNEGKSILEAVKEAGEARFTPIVLTTATTIGGLLPLTLQGGSMWAPMGWTIIGGLIASTFLTLLVVPVLYKLYTK